MCSWLDGEEASLQYGSKRTAGRAGLGILVSWLALGTLALPSCSEKTGSSFMPDPSSPYLGRWAGTIISDLLGPGTIDIVIDSQIGSDSFPLLSGTWSLSFADAAFSARGVMTANLNAERTMLVLFFDRGPVPCPAEPWGVAEKGMFASMTVTRGRMHGSYIAGSCPGGSMDLSRQ